MLNIRTVLLSVVVLLVLGFGARLVTAGTEVISDPSIDTIHVMDNPAEPANQNSMPIPAYRSPLDECFGVVNISERASCRSASPTIQDTLNGRYERRCCGLPY